MNKQDVIEEGTNHIRGGTMAIPVAIEWAFDKGRESAAYAIRDFRDAATGKSNMPADATLDVKIDGQDSVDPRSMTPTIPPDGVVGIKPVADLVEPGVDKTRLGGYDAETGEPVLAEDTSQKVDPETGARLEAGDTDNHSTERQGATIALAQGVTLPGPDGTVLPSTPPAPAVVPVTEAAAAANDGTVVTPTPTVP